MYINDMPPGSTVSLEAIVGLKTLAFDTVVEKSVDVPMPGVYVAPIMKDDKIIGFQGDGITCRATIIHDEEKVPYQWKNVKVVSMKTQDGNFCHAIYSEDDVKKVNRRTNYRVWLGFHGQARIGMAKEVIDVTVKDISCTGISFICPQEVEVKMGAMVHLNFSDPGNGINFVISALVVRREELERGNALYGCKLSKESQMIERYVNQKQRERAKHPANQPLKK